MIETKFRVEKTDLFTLAEVLQIPEVFKCHQRSKIDGVEGLCMLLKCCAYLCHYSDMMHRFHVNLIVFTCSCQLVCCIFVDVFRWQNILRK